MALFAVAVAAVFLASPLLALVAYARVKTLQRELEDVRVQVRALRSWIDRQSRAAPAADGAARAGEPIAPAAGPPPVPLAVPTAAPPVTVAPPPVPGTPLPPVPPRTRPSVMPPPAAGDFATNRGPKILVAGSALAFMVFAGLLVQYA